MASGLESPTMGRTKKSAPKSASKAGPKQVAFRASAEWAEWLERGAKFCRTDVAKLLDAATIDYLKARGFKEEPPDRIP